jgi:thiamine pyrophosphate-dependent acetolactate synthase large subunit-like protein
MQPVEAMPFAVAIPAKTPYTVSYNFYDDLAGDHKEAPHMHTPVDTRFAPDRPALSSPVRHEWGSDFMAEMMRHLGLEYLALNPGASYRGLHDSLVNFLGNARPEMLVVLHEEHAVAIAHGYAKITGRPMGAVLHANVGLMHASMGIFDAFCDRVPVIIFGANGPGDAAKRRPWIDWLHTMKDQGALIRPFVKFDAEPRSLADAAESMMRARQIACTLPCGPVYVCFDVGLQEAKFDAFPALPEVARYAPPEPPHASASSVAQLAHRLVAAKRLIILAGRVSRDALAWQRRVALVEHLGATVMTDLKVASAFPTDHPLHPAPPAMTMPAPGLAALREADVILSLDWVDLGGLLKTAYGEQRINAHVVQTSLDQTVHTGFGMELQGLPPADTYLLADPDALVADLLPIVQTLCAQRHTGGSVKPTPTVAEAGNPSTASGIAIRAFAYALANRCARQETALLRVNLGWPGEAWHFRSPLDYLGYDGGAGVGSGPGMAVGAALALRGTGRMPVAVLGDGDYLMGVTAFWTAVKYRIPLLVIVANNRSFFNDEAHQERVATMRGRPPENKWVGQRIEEPDIDLAALARGQGARAWGPVRDLDALHRALDEAVAAVSAGEVAIVDAHVAQEYAQALTTAFTRGKD